MSIAAAAQTTFGNRLIDSLHPEDRAPLLDRLQVWTGQAQQVIWEPGDDVDHAYFPLGRAMASYRVALSDGRAVETGLIGREGALGGIVSQGRLPAYARAVVQFEGRFARLPVSQLEALKAANRRVENLFARYADCLLAQIFQATACNATHSIEQRAAKWLIAAAERMETLDVPMTHEQLGGLLGVGRSYVSRVLGRFREEGLVRTRRSRLVISDPVGLAATACDCDENVKRHFGEVLTGVYPPPCA